MSEIISCEDLEASVDRYTKELGYRLDMIAPADSPTAALLSRNAEKIRLERSKPQATDDEPRTTNATEWIAGRAGMMYRDLIPGRLGGRMIASHIRITEGGEVPDYVHYHRVKFQMIYCVRGTIKVVYEDQGKPFWLNPGDCVLQPPEIRHRVLYAEAGSEVVEIGVPAVHETWVEHEITLPTAALNPERVFSGQRFVRHIAADATWKPSEFDGFESRDTGISTATGGLADVVVLRATLDASFKCRSPRISKGVKHKPPNDTHPRDFVFYFVLKGGVKFMSDGENSGEFTTGDAFVECYALAGARASAFLQASDTEILRVLV